MVDDGDVDHGGERGWAELGVGGLEEYVDEALGRLGIAGLEALPESGDYGLGSEIGGKTRGGGWGKNSGRIRVWGEV